MIDLDEFWGADYSIIPFQYTTWAINFNLFISSIELTYIIRRYFSAFFWMKQTAY